VILLVDTVNEPFQQVSITRQQIANFLLQNGGISRRRFRSSS